ncbi:NADH dehydrogenase [ubiquinone] 1 beta subcomplex subunit 4 [Cryptotermes secundus]|uniref:NADH dehydrogenase [ubiquinone] 1 beta subcomplex subunit 4 n=1 Tax=Cryptotermes secundus TaxID=105785 RepID=UPI000CD7B5E5|nr:NADH dehydrogenase [ubiquinone] 1 beta subcomplex subunit 4 [Cryptotermes secundus]
MADKQYDVSEATKRSVEAYAKRRAILREEYIKQITNPHRHGTGEGGTLFDSGIQRFMSMRATEYEHFKPTPKTSMYGLGIIVIPIVAYAYLLKTTRDAQEHKYRTGQVAYKDRRFKFI